MMVFSRGDYRLLYFDRFRSLSNCNFKIYVLSFLHGLFYYSSNRNYIPMKNLINFGLKCMLSCYVLLVGA